MRKKTAAAVSRATKTEGGRLSMKMTATFSGWPRVFQNREAKADY